MVAATVSSKGQITIPAEVRAALGLRAGSRVEFVPTGEGAFELAAVSGSVTRLKGIVPSPGIPASLDDMADAIAAGAAGADE